MNRREFYAAIQEYQNNSIEHAAKGSTWKNHKYIRIENGRYIYPGDKMQSLRDHFNSVSKAAGSNDKLGTTKDSNPEHPTPTRNSVKTASKIYSTLDAVKHPGMNTPIQAENQKKDAQEKVINEALEYFRANGGTFKEGDNSLIFKDKFEKVGLAQKDLSQPMSQAKREAKQKESEKRQEQTKQVTSLSADEARKRAEEITAAKQRQAETKKIESLTLEEARKRAAEITKTKETEAANKDQKNDSKETFNKKYNSDSSQANAKMTGILLASNAIGAAESGSYSTTKNVKTEANILFNDLQKTYDDAIGAGYSKEEAKEFCAKTVSNVNRSFNDYLKSDGYNYTAYDTNGNEMTEPIVITYNADGKPTGITWPIDFKQKSAKHSLNSIEEYMAAINGYKQSHCLA